MFDFEKAQKQYWHDFSSAMRSFANTEPAAFDFIKDSTFPAMGPSRESIEMLQEWKSLLADYHQASLEYQPLLMQIGFEAWKQTLIKVGESMNHPSPLTGRQVYDIWIDCGEKAYAQTVTTENYQKTHGRFANAAMACKKQSQANLQGVLCSLDLPTKKDLNSVYERIQALTRELKNAKKDIACLKQQMAECIKDSKDV